MDKPESFDELRARLNAETARISWKELERHFARGVVIRVGAGLDLVEVAAHMVRDDKEILERWLTSGRVGQPSAEDATGWHERNADFWAVVTAPWVLVQEVRGEADER